MAECSEISLMLGAFEDGELEPHELQAVARHLATCAACERELSTYALIGRELRALKPEPGLAGFSGAVTARIAQLRMPLAVRAGQWIGRAAEQLRAAMPTAALTAAVAVLTAVIVTPYASELLDRMLPRTEVARNGGAQVGELQQTARASTGDSLAEISRLEAKSPSVAVWSEPRTATTVIWLPD
jgi:anti-sigma factor RsiW